MAELSGSALELIASWMRQYNNLPMDPIDAGLAAGGTPAEPFVIKTTRKAAAGPVPIEFPKK